MEDKATAAIGNADPDANEYLAHTQRARAAMMKARTDLDNHVAFHHCTKVAAKTAYCPIVKRYTGAVAPYDPPEQCHYGFALTGDKLCFANKWKSKTGMPACNH
jgi:hypothetical protein